VSDTGNPVTPLAFLEEINELITRWGVCPIIDTPPFTFEGAEDAL